MKLLRTSLIAITFLQAGCALSPSVGEGERAEPAPNLSTMSAEQKKEEQQYFRSHAFEFSSIFSAHHPGPYWILENAEQFQFSSEQIKQQEELKFGMAKATISGNAALRKAYEKYASDASAPEPSLAVIKQWRFRLKRSQHSGACEATVPAHVKPVFRRM